jgi:DNA repair protein RecO
MYSIYNTPALVLNKKDHSDNDVVLTFLTKEFGLIRAVATGLRKEKSKLRFSLQAFSVTDVSLVKGKGMWRVTNAKHIESLVGEKNNILDKIKLTIERLVYGEEGSDLYNIVVNGVKTDSKDYESVERIIIMRILNELGYIERKGLNDFFKDTNISIDLIEKSNLMKKDIIKFINNAFKVSNM